MSPVKPECWIFDFDGTIVDNREISVIDHDAELKNTYCIYASCRLLRSLFDNNQEVIILTARNESFREELLSWLKQYNLNASELIMRSDGDIRSDIDFKRDVILNQILPKYDIVGAFDDHKPVVEMLRSLEITTFDVAGNDYKDT